MENKTSISQIKESVSGVLETRIRLSVVDENQREVSFSWHRVSTAPGENFNEQITLVNSELMKGGKEPLPQIEKEKVDAQVTKVHTPEKIQEYVDKQEIEKEKTKTKEGAKA